MDDLETSEWKYAFQMCLDNHASNPNSDSPISRCYYKQVLAFLALINFIVMLWLMVMHKRRMNFMERIKSKKVWIYGVIATLDLLLFYYSFFYVKATIAQYLELAFSFLLSVSIFSILHLLFTKISRNVKNANRWSNASFYVMVMGIVINMVFCAYVYEKIGTI